MQATLSGREGKAGPSMPSNCRHTKVPPAKDDKFEVELTRTFASPTEAHSMAVG